MKPNKISKEEWMAYCDKLTASQKVSELAKKYMAIADKFPSYEELIREERPEDFVFDPYADSEWTGAKQGTTIGVEEEKQWEIDRLHRKIKKLELELSEVKFERAMLTCELNARGK